MVTNGKHTAVRVRLVIKTNSHRHFLFIMQRYLDHAHTHMHAHSFFPIKTQNTRILLPLHTDGKNAHSGLDIQCRDMPYPACTLFTDPVIKQNDLPCTSFFPSVLTFHGGVCFPYECSLQVISFYVHLKNSFSSMSIIKTHFMYAFAGVSVCECVCVL